MNTLPILRAVLTIKLRTITYTNLQPSTKYIHISALKLEIRRWTLNTQLHQPFIRSK